MKARIFTALLLGLALGAASAQDSVASPQSSNPGPVRQESRGGRGLWGGGMIGGGRGFTGIVTAVAADHYSVRNEAGEVYTVYFSANTRIIKQRLHRGPDGPDFIRPSDIKVGDPVATMGEVDAGAKAVGAIFVVQLDPERYRQIQKMEADYGKTWLMGRVTAIDGVKVTLEGIRDKQPCSFVADENTLFRHRRNPITLADIHSGDLIHVEGAIKNGVFLAATVNDVGNQQQLRMQRNLPPASQSPVAPPQ